MTINELEEFKGISSECQAIQSEIDSLYNPYHSPCMQATGGHGSTPSNPTEQAVERIMAKEQELIKRSEELAKRLELIENWLDTINDPEIRSMIRWHYLLNLDWRKTCLKVYGYPSYTACKNRVRRFFGMQ